MTNLIKHIIYPSLAPLLIVVLYFTPKSVFGCANRGLLALLTVFISTLIALATSLKYYQEKRQWPRKYSWWLATTMILLLPLYLLFGPLG